MPGRGDFTELGSLGLRSPRCVLFLPCLEFGWVWFFCHLFTGVHLLAILFKKHIKVAYFLKTEIPI